ncbi:HD domain-containing protein [Halomarina oriensis]|uniref:HD domain-containing protein n=1 Tax=Halomarina oriensis TaxID=671145 RepID=A0A6B0GQU1_9EURY|nr:HD domain-containing protein [Halomarina oriensis]MWG35737.1 HD domain-containing protein [Halomarina oriensis]
MISIKDSVHDHIEVDGVAEALLDTPIVQRLRRIRQLGTVSFVYPSANHTRFEHSLGVYHLADRALSNLDIEGANADRIRAAALLHDTGHGPYSHNLEDLIYRQTGRYHDEIDDLLTEGQVGEVLREYGLSPSAVADLVRGDGKYGQLVSGELDVDRMDYLVRDAHHTGVPYGTIDTGRLVRELDFTEGELVLGEGNVQTGESLLLARALMNPTVYSHHVARISKSMLRRAAEGLLRAGATDAWELRRMDDRDLTVALRQCEETAEYARRLDTRDLYKRAVWAEFDAVDDALIDADHDTIREYERDVADEADVDPEHVVLDIPSRPSIPESTSRVVVNGQVRRLRDQSTLVQAVLRVQEDQWRLGVYAPRDVTERVGHAAERVLGLDLDALVSDIRGSRPATLDEFEGH